MKTKVGYFEEIDLQRRAFYLIEFSLNRLLKMSRSSVLKIKSVNAVKVENFRQSLYKQAEDLFSNYIPLKITQLDNLLKEEDLSITDLSTLHAPLDIPIPDPPTPEDEEMETDKNDDDEKKKKAPKCGFIKGNEKIVKLLDRVKPEILALRETIITVSCWIQHLIPKIEDGNDFGVAIQEKILERITAVKTKVDGFHTNINKYFSERGDAVAKASKLTHVMDYRSLVHEKDEAVYSDIRVILLDIRGFYAELYDIISKNLEKVTNPKGEEKPSMY
ncbi:proteasome activator complex subunit 2-like isoform X1 [Salvelinus fontinalis]|uniref:proteasome activator complex subunit 2-like isoform X1 n=1 Tax=Salvelinus fontinalis TaxID=8038 RepID=UPI0024864C4F|nr:proteasome activator complex subunit 2-like isoform X1 [Salvelinus fontinalis]